MPNDPAETPAEATRNATNATNATNAEPTAPPRSSLDSYYQRWETKVKGMQAASAAVDWSKYDFSKLNPKDISVQFGPMLTEEEFKRLRQR